MDNRIKKLKLAHEQRPMALGDLIHQHVRAAVEQAVHEELAAVLGVGLYERSEARSGHRNGSKTRTLTGLLLVHEVCPLDSRQRRSQTTALLSCERAAS